MNETEIIYSDKDIIVINKPAGISVHQGDSVSGLTATDYLLKKFPEIKKVGDEPAVRPGIVHRLDKNTSGVMVVARHQKSFELLKELFKKRLVEKTYLAIVCGKIREKRGTISLEIGRIAKNPLKRGTASKHSQIKGSREAITEYKVIKAGDKYTLLELKPRTGRMHQLRVHLKAIGHPVACDQLYGGKNVCCPYGANRPAEDEARLIGRQLLHAKSISFSFPEGRRLHFEADVPEDFTVAEKQIL